MTQYYLHVIYFLLNINYLNPTNTLFNVQIQSGNN